MFFSKFIQKLPYNRVVYCNSYWIIQSIKNNNVKSIFYIYNHPTLTYNCRFNTKSLVHTFNEKFLLYFLKKEVFYTKLKYSRVPQFDTSSGASASFLSGFYGFLVCEKFGFELIDSGDFFFLVIYIILYVWIIIIFTQIFNHNSNLITNFLILLKSFK